jgi:hypothetical protein
MMAAAFAKLCATAAIPQAAHSAAASRAIAAAPADMSYQNAALAHHLRNAAVRFVSGAAEMGVSGEQGSD